MYLRYVLSLLFISFPFNLLAYALAPILPLFRKELYGQCNNASHSATEPRLPNWLSWFMTPDNSLWGDGGWKTEHCPNYKSYWGMVKWLWKNPAYGFEWEGPLNCVIEEKSAIVVKGDPSIQNRPFGKEGVCIVTLINFHGKDYFHYCKVKDLGIIFGKRRCLYLNFGWKLKTFAENLSRLKSGQKAMFVFSPRITEFKPNNA